MLLDTYPGILGRNSCPKEHWKSQGLIKVVEYLTSPSYYLRTRHRFRGKFGWIFYTFISEGEMLSILQGLYSTTNKGEHHMVSSNSFLLQRCKSVKEACYLTTTKTSTRPACLDLGGTRSFLRKWRFKVPDMKPETFPLDSFTRWLIG